MISIDDFGTGFSSLSYLKRLPIDTLKIDQSFIRDLTSNQDDAALVMAIITLAHNLRLRVVAEGVETDEQWRFLHLLRCDEIQGFAFSKPLAPDDLERLLTSRQALLVSDDSPGAVNLESAFGASTQNEQKSIQKGALCKHS
jgi:EAL domain-containing protein (putative c-di-GMP-specific phosphodiesterase class I)